MFLNVSWKKFGFSSYIIWAGWYLTRSLTFEKEMCLGALWFLWLGIRNQLPWEGLDSPPNWIWPWRGPLCRPGVCAPAGAWGLPQWMEGLPPSLGRVLSTFVSFCATEGGSEYPPFLDFWDEVLASAAAGDLLADFNAQWRWKLKGWLEGLPPPKLS